MLAPGLIPDATTSGALAERAEAREVDGGRRRALDREHRDVGQLGPGALGHRDRLRRGGAGRSTRPAPLRSDGGRDHADVVAGVVQRRGERDDPGRGSTPSSFVTSTRRRRSRSSVLASRRVGLRGRDVVRRDDGRRRGR